MCWRLQRRGKKEEIPSQGSGLREEGKEEKIIGQAEAEVVLSVRLIGRNVLVVCGYTDRLDPDRSSGRAGRTGGQWP